MLIYADYPVLIADSESSPQTILHKKVGESESKRLSLKVSKAEYMPVSKQVQISVCCICKIILVMKSEDWCFLQGNCKFCVVPLLPK